MRLPALASSIVAFLLLPVTAVGQQESNTDRVLEAILGALNLPGVVEAARDEGVADSTLVGVLDEMRRTALPASEAEDVFDQEVEAVRAGGPVGNFGAFVQSQLASGLRGRALAEAIRAEHRRMGIGMPERRPERMRAGNRGRGRGGPGVGARGQSESGARGRGQGASGSRGRGEGAAGGDSLGGRRGRGGEGRGGAR